HGAAVRHAPQAPICRASLPEIPHSWLEEAGRLAAARPGVLLERKQASFVLHYRLAPAEGPALLAALQALAGEAADRFTVMSAHMAWEVKPRGVDKARAVAALMGRAPFAGRRPVYIGDDVTDEDGMRAARALGGLGWRVQDVFTDAAGVRAWLSRLAGR
ncbi:MAG: trehalose-phosphatase, partial [Rhodospirillales bacterium]|nr:trehalose-phosphatase [Rhodospirillales bacterium]